MSQLTDAIREVGPAAAAAAIANDPTWRVFNLLWTTPEEIIPACDKMGWQTLDDLVSWLQRVNLAVGDAAAFEYLVDPPAPASIGGMKTIAWPKLHESIFATGLLSTDCLLHNSDGQYHLPTKVQWDAIAAACPTKRRKAAGGELYDCDDFVRAAQGWLAQKGLGNLAAAFAATRHYLGATATGGHAVVLVWDANLTPWQWEPQTGILHPAAYPKLGGNFLAQRVEYARVFA